MTEQAGVRGIDIERIVVTNSAHLSRTEIARLPALIAAAVADQHLGRRADGGSSVDTIAERVVSELGAMR